MVWRQMTLAGWGRVRQAESHVARPERLSELQGALAAASGPVIGFGGGRSYGDAALNGRGETLLTTRLDRFLSFDERTGELVAEPGVTWGDLLDQFLPRGFMAPVTPGTAFATLGGGIANDVHGKNQETAGCIGDHVNWLDILTASGEVVRTSRDHHPDLFRATLGGLGLTGIITALSLTMTRVPGSMAMVEARRLPDLDATLDALTGPHPDQPYRVAWIDALAGGRGLGRGILEAAGPVEGFVPERRVPARSLPVDLPGFVLGTAGVKAFNALYWRRVPAAGRQSPVPWRQFLYPLDRILHWNRLYGRQGFHQFQCVVPHQGGPDAIRKLLEAFGRAGRASFLAVLKAMGRPGAGDLSFAMPGLTLAVDIPNRSGVEELLRELERITLDAGGRAYLAKDSALSAEGFRAMYPDLPRFRETLDRWDPAGRFDSDLARRLRIREDAR